MRPRRDLTVSGLSRSAGNGTPPETAPGTGMFYAACTVSDFENNTIF